ncbi:hypothetical protein SD37_16765 [Amycolatopsis orientalis]|uniref:O-methyltransferase C-terminal domain-containing protein n=1 Tax=Amycolatopsis orientalis TaxID=31958 RepID=A0A193BY22_AMYOR|nr:class I SAM-dependent methyltransferase [Amycolatopsis orientalis]ANN17131.1 hypothetical protein SD37_16765 [Amycolatopsis orientalis]
MIDQLFRARKTLALIEAADDLKLLEELARGPRRTTELAELTRIAPEVLRDLLELLAWSGVLSEDGERWTLGQEWAPLVGSGGRDGVLPLLRIERWAAEDHLNARGIVAALRGHRCPPEIPRRHVGDLAEAMARGARATAPHVARLPEWRDRRHFADLAGGSGGYAITLCRLHGDLRATVYDRPEMLAHAEKNVAEAGLADRIDLVPWNLTADEVPAGHDSVVLSHVLHLLDADQRAGLLRRVRSALGEGDLVVVHDFLGDQAEQGPEQAALVVDWLANGSGFLLDREGLAAELANAALTAERIVPIKSANTTLMIARCSTTSDWLFS